MTVLIVAIFFPGVSYAVNKSRSQSDHFYYEIGGARATFAPSNYSKTIAIGGSTRISSNLSCGKFNLDDNLSKLFNNLNNQLDRAVDAVVYAAESAIATLPLYLIRRADPNLANMLENALARYENYLQLSVRSCKQAEAMIMDGKNPYADWIKIGKAGRWKEKTVEAETNTSVTATETYESILDGEKLCVTWIGDEKRACEEGEPIQLIKEITQRGYELASGQGHGEREGALGSGDARLTSVFDNQTVASDWLVEVVGDMTIDNRPDAVPSGTPGYGVSKDMGELSGEIYDALTLALAEGGTNPATEDVLSVPGLEANATLINAIRAIPVETRESALRKVATEMAMLKTMEKINLARQLLLTGARDPYVINSPAHEAVHQTFLPQLDAEYRLLKDQYETQQRVATSTMSLLVKRHQQQRAQRPDSSGAENRSGRIEQGAVSLDEVEE